MKKVKYRVKSSFGSLEKGSFVEGYLVASEYDDALIFFPKNKDGCACIVICRKVSNFYEEKHEEAFVNLEKRNKTNKALINFFESQI